MFMPVVLAWMKEQSQFTTDRINCLCFVVLFVVATLTCQRQVVGSQSTTQDFRKNVFVRMSLSRVRIRANAVLTATECTLFD